MLEEIEIEYNSEEIRSRKFGVDSGCQFSILLPAEGNSTAKSKANATFTSVTTDWSTTEIDVPVGSEAGIEEFGKNFSGI
jgi:hypothetical protein